jgi:hypothetical protein
LNGCAGVHAVPNIPQRSETARKLRMLLHHISAVSSERVLIEKPNLLDLQSASFAAQFRQEGGDTTEERSHSLNIFR